MEEHIFIEIVKAIARAFGLDVQGWIRMFVLFVVAAIVMYFTFRFLYNSIKNFFCNNKNPNGDENDYVLYEPTPKEPQEVISSNVLENQPEELKTQQGGHKEYMSLGEITEQFEKVFGKPNDNNNKDITWALFLFAAILFIFYLLIKH